MALVVGLIAGLTSTALLESLNWASRTFAERSWLLFVLPAGGLVVGLATTRGGPCSARGTTLLIDEVHNPTVAVPGRMAPLVFAGTVATHVFGGSAGREGTAVQMAAGVADSVLRPLRLDADDRSVMLLAAIAGGFGSAFGVPFAGAVFALEVLTVRRRRIGAAVPCLIASFVGDRVVRAFGVHHTVTPDMGRFDLDLRQVLAVVICGVRFGLAARGFVVLVHGAKQLAARVVPWAPGRPIIGGTLVVALTLLFGTRAYNGLSIGLLETSLAGGHVPTWAFAAKVLLTVITLGSGFVGGEVTPLLVIGATLGATLAGVAGVPVPILAAIGFAAVFGAATKTPLASTVMAAELFGLGVAPLVAVACVLATLASGQHTIYRRGQ